MNELENLPPIVSSPRHNKNKLNVSISEPNSITDKKVKHLQSNFELNNNKSKAILNLKLKPNIPIHAKFHANKIRQKPIINTHGYYESIAKHNVNLVLNMKYNF